MYSQGDIAPSQTVYNYFSTFSISGTPASLSGSVVAVAIYKNNSTTESISGVTVTKDFDGRIGLNLVTINTAADPTFFASGDFSLIIISGSVGGLPWGGTEVGAFSMNNRTPLRPAVSGRTLDVSTSGTATANITQLENVGLTSHAAGAVPADVRYISGSIINPAVVQIGANVVTKTGFSLATPQSFDLIGNISGTQVGNQIGNIQGSVANVTGSVGGVTGLTPSNLDVAISSRMASGTVTVGVNNDKTGYSVTGLTPSLLDVAVSSRQASGTVVVGSNTDKTGYGLSSPQNFNLIGNITGSIQGNIVQVITGSASSDPWSTAIPGAYGAGTAGNILGNKLDANVSSRQASGTVVVGSNTDKSGYNLSTPQSFTLIGNISGTHVGNQVGNIQGSVANVTGSVGGVSGLTPSNLDVAVSSRMQSGTVVVSQNNDKAGYGVTGLNPALLDVAVSTRQASGTVNVQDKTGFSLASPQNVTIIGNISGSMTAVYNVISGSSSGGPTVPQIVNGVWEEAIAGHLNPGSVGSKLNSAGAAGDPWSTSLPGAYLPGEAGNIIGNYLDFSGSSAALMWSYPTRALTTPAGNILPSNTANAAYVYRGDTLIWSITGLGSLVSLSKLYFTVKRTTSDLDTKSIIQVEMSAGLIYLNGLPVATPANGNITINNVANGDITITIAAIEMAKLDLIGNMDYDIQIIRSSGVPVSTLQVGTFGVVGDVTKATI